MKTTLYFAVAIFLGFSFNATAQNDGGPSAAWDLHLEMQEEKIRQKEKEYDKAHDDYHSPGSTKSYDDVERLENEIIQEEEKLKKMHEEKHKQEQQENPEPQDNFIVVPDPNDSPTEPENTSSSRYRYDYIPLFFQKNTHTEDGYILGGSSQVNKINTPR